VFLLRNKKRKRGVPKKVPDKYTSEPLNAGDSSSDVEIAEVVLEKEKVDLEE
jgi:hypothetical protein